LRALANLIKNHSGERKLAVEQLNHTETKLYGK